MSDFYFDFETLDMYKLALQVARWVRRADWPRGWGALKDQVQRASASVVLNIAEGRLHQGKSRTHHYRIAFGSIGEVVAALQVVELPGQAEHEALARRVGQMLSATLRRRV
jgi:four helix bundle protein